MPTAGRSEPRRIVSHLVSALRALITAFGCLFTFPALPTDYSFEKPLPFLLGHFMTSGISVDRHNLKKTRFIQTRDGEVEVCISRCWNLWRRAVGDQFSRVGVWNVVPFEAHGSARQAPTLKRRAVIHKRNEKVSRSTRDDGFNG